MKQSEADNLRGVKRKVGEIPDSSAIPGAVLQYSCLLSALIWVSLLRVSK